MVKLLWCLLFPALLITAMYAYGHDPTGLDSYHDWFVSQMQEPVKVGDQVYQAPCCGAIDEAGGDAHYVDVMRVNDQWFVRIGDNWVLYSKPVEPYHNNPTGHNVVWYKKFDDSTIVFYCLRLSLGV